MICLPERSESTLLANLTAAQQRSNELLEEARAARQQAAAYKLAAESLTASLHDMATLVEEQRAEIEALRAALAVRTVPDGVPEALS